MRSLHAMVLVLTGIFVLLSAPSPAESRVRGFSQQPVLHHGRRRRYRSRRPYRNPSRRPSHPSSTSIYDYQSHFLDDPNWLTDKASVHFYDQLIFLCKFLLSFCCRFQKVRIWNGRSNYRKPNDRSWSGRIVFANIVCYALQAFNPSVTRWGVKLSEKILNGQDLYRLITPVFLHGGLYQ